MKKQIFVMLMLEMLCTSSFVLSQSKNRITVQTGLFHYFFDDSPILNINHRHEESEEIFNGLLINSLGLKYNRLIDEKSFLSAEFSMFYESYRKHYKTFPLKEPMVGERGFSTYNFNYGRILPLNSHFDIVYGGGINYRRGTESIIISSYYFGVSPSGVLMMEHYLTTVVRNDIGINAFAGIEYTPLKWLTLSTKINLLGFVYINDKENTRKMKDVYDSPQYPSRLDLSFNLGLGFNF